VAKDQVLHLYSFYSLWQEKLSGSLQSLHVISLTSNATHSQQDLQRILSSAHFSWSQCYCG